MVQVGWDTSNLKVLTETNGITKVCTSCCGCPDSIDLTFSGVSECDPPANWPNNLNQLWNLPIYQDNATWCYYLYNPDPGNDWFIFGIKWKATNVFRVGARFDTGGSPACYYAFIQETDYGDGTMNNCHL
ncbi:hypothetical protein KAR91_04275, partial [Candidatus Pacearchaeota archaeon]|nr:hypothetical protein [Candidatus Pacearchaeota archaeon]